MRLSLVNSQRVKTCLKKDGLSMNGGTLLGVLMSLDGSKLKKKLRMRLINSLVKLQKKQNTLYATSKKLEKSNNPSLFYIYG